MMTTNFSLHSDKLVQRRAQRVPLGIARVGGHGSNGSGDIFLAFSTANQNAFNRDETVNVTSLPNDRLTPLFEATTHAVEEAIVNAMVAAEAMETNNSVLCAPTPLLVFLTNDITPPNDNNPAHQ